jgi:hypothetical protein
VLNIECDKCGRKGQYRVDHLIEQYGIDAKLFDWEPEADCPRKQARNLNDICGARCPDLTGARAREPAAFGNPRPQPAVTLRVLEEFNDLPQLGLRLFDVGKSRLGISLDVDFRPALADRHEAARPLAEATDDEHPPPYRSAARTSRVTKAHHNQFFEFIVGSRGTA